MRKEVVTEKYLFDGLGRVCGRVVTTEIYEGRTDMELYDIDTRNSYIDAEEVKPELPEARTEVLTAEVRTEVLTAEVQ